MFHITISGGPELAKSLRELGDLTSDRRAVSAIKDGMVRAGQQMADIANHIAPSDNEGGDRVRFTSAKSLTARQRKEARRESRDRILTYVGQEGGSNIPLLLEFGTVQRHHQSGKAVGAITPTPTMRPAFDTTARDVLNAMVPAISEQVMARAKRVASRPRKKFVQPPKVAPVSGTLLGTRRRPK